MLNKHCIRQNYVKILINSFCEVLSNETNDIHNTFNTRKTINKIIVDLYDVCVNQIIRYRYYE